MVVPVGSMLILWFWYVQKIWKNYLHFVCKSFRLFLRLRFCRPNPEGKISEVKRNFFWPRWVWPNLFPHDVRNHVLVVDKRNYRNITSLHIPEGDFLYFISLNVFRFASGYVTRLPHVNFPIHQMARSDLIVVHWPPQQMRNSMHRFNWMNRLRYVAHIPDLLL